MTLSAGVVIYPLDIPFDMGWQVVAESAGNRDRCLILGEVEVDDGSHDVSLVLDFKVGAMDRQSMRLVLCYDSCESRGSTTCAQSGSGEAMG